MNDYLDDAMMAAQDRIAQRLQQRITALMSDATARLDAVVLGDQPREPYRTVAVVGQPVREIEAP